MVVARSVADSECEYTTVDVPCTHCLERGFTCDEKVSANDWRQRLSGTVATHGARALLMTVPRQPPTPPDELLSPFEGMHIQSLRNRDFLFRFKLLQFSRGDGLRMADNIFRRFGSNLSSKPIRYGAILYSLFKFKETASDSQIHVVYRNEFYKAVRDAIKREAFPELVYGCYAGCLYSLRVNRNVGEIMEHAKGFWLSVSHLKGSSDFVGEEQFFLECMWEKLLWVMTRELLFTNAAPAVVYLNQLVDFAQPLFSSDCKHQATWIQESFVEVQVKLQFIRLVATLDLNGTANSVDLKSSLMKKFLRWVKTSPDSWDDPTSRYNKVALRNRSRKLWSELLTLLSCLIVPADRVSYIDQVISSIHSTIDLIQDLDCEWLPTELRDSAISSLALMGMVVSELQLDNPNGSTC